MKKYIIALLMIFMLSACTTRISGITLISDKNIQSKNVIRVSQLSKTKNVVGTSNKFLFLFIPFGTPTLQEALDDALTKANGDLMIDASLYYTWWWFLIGQQKFELKGTVVNTKERAKK